VTGRRRSRSLAGWGRAFGACCLAGKLRSLAGPVPDSVARAGWTLSESLRGAVAYPLGSGGGFVLVKPLGAVEQPRRMVRFARLIHRPRARA
jgi:hypothetical protein